MKVLLLTPTYFPQLTGNAVTVHRIATGLSQLGAACKVMDLSRISGIDLLDAAGSFSPDLIHNFHAYKSGRSGLLLKKILGVPMVTTMTGTDINVDLKEDEREKTIQDVLEASDIITVFNDHAFSVLRKHGVPGDKIRIVHQSVLLEEKSGVDFRSLQGVDREDVVFLMSGGIRRIKHIGYAIDVLTEVKKVRPHLRFFIAGLVLETEEYDRIEKRLHRRPWITYLGQVGREYIPSLLKSVDVVLNTSASESEANALLEAFSCRKIVIARRIPGNASLLTEKTGFLFRNRREFYEKAIYVIDHPAALDGVRHEADRLMRTIFSFSEEQAGYAAVYEALVGPWRKKDKRGSIS
jgi:glycosyltransferase involved in cell wall biosynthesis